VEREELGQSQNQLFELELSKGYKNKVG